MATLYDRHSGLVYSVALRVLRDPAAAEDVLQEVLLQLWRRPDLFEASRGNLPAWLAVTARNRAIDQLRKRKPEDDILEMGLPSAADLEADVVGRDITARVRHALTQLPAAQRQALEMAVFEGKTHTEIAAETSTPLGTVKTRIRSGLQEIRKLLS